MSGKQISMGLFYLILDLSLYIGDKITNNGKTLLIFGSGYLAAHLLIWIF
jgi:hypothetical protein